MTLIDEVVLFARDYINKRSFRTTERKEKIREALRSLTGEFITFGCSTCYIEALFKILNLTKMATPKGHELKKGVVLQAFGDASKTCTNLTLTDELAEWYLQNYPEKSIYFAKIPGVSAPVPTPPANMTIINPVVNNKEKKIKELKDSLKANKDVLIERAKTENLPVNEWEDLNKSDLINYLFSKLSKGIE